MGVEVKKEAVLDKALSGANGKKAPKWKKPALEDVSGKVMAQPYIRFT